MADPAQESSAQSNKTLTSLTPGTSANQKKQTVLSHLQSSWFQRFVQTNAGPLSVSPSRLTVEKGALSEESQHNLVLHKHDDENNAFVGSGSTIALNSFNLQLDCTEEEEERTKGCSRKVESSKLPGFMQKETVTGVGNLENNRASDIADAKLGDEISTFPKGGSYNFRSREISDELQSSSLVVERSGEPSAHISSVFPWIEQQFCSQHRNSEQVTFSGIETQKSKTETTSVIPSANSVSAFRAIPISMRKETFSRIETQKSKTETTSVIPPANSVYAFRATPISMRKPPLPPGAGAVTRMKVGASLQSNKVDCHGTTLNFRKRQKASESATNKVIPGTKSDKEVCAKRGNSYSFYNKTINKGAGGGLTAKFEMFDKVASAATNPTVELVTPLEDIQSAYPESSLQGKSSYQQGFSAFRNDIMSISTGRRGICESDSKMVSSLSHRGKHFQHPTRGMTGKVHLQSFFEKEGKHIGEFTLGESLGNNDGTALQVTKASSQKGPALFATTAAPILESQDPSRSLEISSNDQVPGNMATLSKENSVHFKSVQAECTHCDGESSSAESSRSEKSQVNVLVQRAIFTNPSSPQNREEMQVEASSASSKISFLCKTLIESYYRAQGQCYTQNQGDQMAMMRIDQMSCKTAHQKGASQLPLKSGLQQAQQNFAKCVEGYECSFQSSDIDGRVGKVDADRLQKKSNQIEIDICTSDSKRKGTMLGADIEAILPSQYGDCSRAKAEGLLPENSIARHPSYQASTLEYRYLDTGLHSSKRSRKTLQRDDKMLDSFHSEKVVAQCSGATGSKNPEDIQLHHRAELTKASVDAMEYNRLTAIEKESREQHHMHVVSNQGDVSPSCLGKHPRHSDHLASSSLVNYTGSLHTPVEQNIVGSMQHSAENTTLQTRVEYSGKSAYPSSQRKIDIASVLSLPWIQRWCPSYQIKSSLFEKHCGSATTREINLRSHSVKTLPSAAAMAIVGIASRQLQPSRRERKGSSRF